MSRSSDPRMPPSGRDATAPTEALRPGIRPPRSNHFGLLDPEADDHPVDAMVRKIPAVAARARRLRQLAAEVQRRCGDHDLFLRYEDLRLHQRIECEEVYYNIGWEHGHLAGRAASMDARTPVDPETRAFGSRLHALLRTSALDERVAAAVMSEFTRALVLTTNPVRFGRRRQRAGRA